jgi:hypothetical protein
MRTSEMSYQVGLGLLGNYSALASGGGDANPDGSRETAYLLHTYNLLSKLDMIHPNRIRSVGFAIGHLDQWFLSRRGDFLVQSFMVGLTCDALIEYWEETKDQRVPWIVKEALDGSVDKIFISRSVSFCTDFCLQ